MTAQRVVLSLIVLGALLALPAIPAFADGKAFPRIAVEAVPDIPQQQALIAFRDGQETMIVESTFETPSPEIGWILPLPAEPTAIAPADAELLDSLATDLRSIVRTADSGAVAWAPAAWWGLGLLVMIILTLLVRDRALAAKKQENGRRLYVDLYALLIGGWFALLILASMFLPTLGGSWQSANVDAGIDVLSQDDVGNYEVSVLQAETADALSDWLAANDLADLSAADRAVVDSYIADGWVFSTARLRVEEGQTLTPHPLAVTFPAAAPIYPMRLTALAGGEETLLRLFIIADGTAEVDGMECVASDVFTHKPSPYAAHGEQTLLRIQHPDARKMIWPGATVTHLRGQISRADMTQDIRPVIAETQPQRQIIYTAAAARTLGGGLVACGLIAAVVSIAVMFAGKRRPRQVWLALPLGLALVGTVTGVVVAATRTVRPVEYENAGRAYFIEHHVDTLATVTELYAFEHGLPSSVADVEGAERFLRQTLVEAGYLREFPEELRRGYGVGEYHLEDHGDEVHVIYNRGSDHPPFVFILKPSPPDDTADTQPAETTQPAGP